MGIRGEMRGIRANGTLGLAAGRWVGDGRENAGFDSGWARTFIEAC